MINILIGAIVGAASTGLVVLTLWLATRRKKRRQERVFLEKMGTVVGLAPTPGRTNDEMREAIKRVFYDRGSGLK